MAEEVLEVVVGEEEWVRGVEMFVRLTQASRWCGAVGLVVYFPSVPGSWRPPLAGAFRPHFYRSPGSGNLVV